MSQYKGYQPLNEPPPAVAHAPSVQQQQSSSNVVLVNQPTAGPTVVRYPSRAEDYLCCSVTLCVLCVLFGNLPAAIFCALPACIFSCIANAHNNAGDYDMASRLGSLACKFNLLVILPSVIMIIVVVTGAVVGILFAAGVIGAAASSVTPY